MPWHVYVLRCRSGALYTGVTTDPLRRLTEHNAGRGAAFTKRHGPAELVYLEAAESRGAALRREHAIKRLSRARKLELVASASNQLREVHGAR
ncbi:GIY-YIG nuclease family protein [Truepera radiovictrix]|uniref:Excinuclease ABC C subunit domain protein n=1 Tax=Truepera radiovictrix (strain DSM 17093 / CIP 108686 / LMG 22925 / RQ-24) TaxID=649638 RepID=D7CR59_TRURR|nr:GIY-YIG nuclease family protein [Truepera radiovictrix]ADI15147.1 Excinuclease ABC C subunit domain protein [Truepera radiovictrix DSM 17093]WMT56300.1 GIY-YIG nuclease family protein [Truepera radiovictrix]